MRAVDIHGGLRIWIDDGKPLWSAESQDARAMCREVAAYWESLRQTERFVYAWLWHMGGLPRDRDDWPGGERGADYARLHTNFRELEENFRLLERQLGHQATTEAYPAFYAYTFARRAGGHYLTPIQVQKVRRIFDYLPSCATDMSSDEKVTTLYAASPLWDWLNEVRALLGADAPFVEDLRMCLDAFRHIEGAMKSTLP